MKICEAKLSDATRASVQVLVGSVIKSLNEHPEKWSPNPYSDEPTCLVLNMRKKWEYDYDYDLLISSGHLLFISPRWKSHKINLGFRNRVVLKRAVKKWVKGNWSSKAYKDELKERQVINECLQTLER
jgi:hypothetical protein